uniref:Uncharacterized protein n=1 Tax=Bactrocera dorsalis TaxID=27457 RepID=A0A034WTL3_BACDO
MTSLLVALRFLLSAALPALIVSASACVCFLLFLWRCLHTPQDCRIFKHNFTQFFVEQNINSLFHNSSWLFVGFCLANFSQLAAGVYELALYIVTLARLLVKFNASTERC